MCLTDIDTFAKQKSCFKTIRKPNERQMKKNWTHPQTPFSCSPKNCHILYKNLSHHFCHNNRSIEPNLHITCSRWKAQSIVYVQQLPYKAYLIEIKPYFIQANQTCCNPLLYYFCNCLKKFCFCSLRLYNDTNFLRNPNFS